MHYNTQIHFEPIVLRTPIVIGFESVTQGVRSYLARGYVDTHHPANRCIRGLPLGVAQVITGHIGQTLRRFQASHFRFETGVGELNQPLQQKAFPAVGRCCHPYRLQCLMRFPEEMSINEKKSVVPRAIRCWMIQ